MDGLWNVCDIEMLLCLNVSLNWIFTIIHRWSWWVWSFCNAVCLCSFKWELYIFQFYPP